MSLLNRKVLERPALPKIEIWNRPLQLFLTLVLGINLVPLISAVPVWVSAIAAILLAVKILQLMGKLSFTRPGVVWTVGIIGCFLIYLTKHTIVGQDASTAILVLLGACKLIETNRYRDCMITITICFFLLVAQLLISQSLFTFIYLVGDVFLILQLLLQLHPAGSTLFSFKSVSRILLIVLPVWVLLFAVFPRFNVSLWHQDRMVSVTGFSDQMSPGDLAQLAQTDDIAFRVKFEGPLPSVSDLYWRGAILTLTEGLRWSKFPPGRLPREHLILKPAVVTHYEVWLEPTYRKWLFALDYPDLNLESNSTLDAEWKMSSNYGIRTPGFIYEAARDIVTRTAYSASARMNAETQTLTTLEEKAFLQLPQIEPTVMALAKKLKDPGNDPEKSMNNVFNWFRTHGFEYTLEPGLLPDQRDSSGLNRFLFQSKQGFCEHYAAAGAVLLRLMKIPARVVLGFQGAERNELGDYWIVRNRHAHAWVEAFVPEPKSKQGRWTRFDLISAVSPVRLALGMEFFQSTPELSQNGNPLSPSAYQIKSSWFTRTQTRTGLVWDAFEMGWARFLLSYDFQFQQDLLSRLGLGDTTRITFFLTLFILLALCLLAIAWWVQRKPRPKNSVLLAWQTFGEKTRALGVVRRANEGPMDFSARLRTEFASRLEQTSLDEIDSITKAFVELRYSSVDSPPTKDKIRGLVMRVKKLKLKTLSSKV